MKKIVFATLTFLALLFAMLPTSTAFAKKDGGAITLNIRNRTGSDVTLTLTTADGSKTTTYKVGTYVSTMPQGTYT